MELALIRHSATRGNLERRYMGTDDQPLAPEGMELARSRAGKMPAVGALWVSPMLRCRQTAELLFPGMPQIVVPELRECDFGAFEGKTWDELESDPLYRRWVAGEDVTPPGGESRRAGGERALTGIRGVVEQANRMGITRAGVVTHGGIMMSVLSICGEPKRGFYDWLVGNCCGYLLDVKEENFTLRVIGQI